MPTPRMVINPNKLVLSKPGQNANNPALPESQKVFDSDWLYGGSIIQRSAHIFRNTDGFAGPYTLNFPAQGYIPSVDTHWYVPAGAVYNLYGGFITLSRDLIIAQGGVSGWAATVHNNRVVLSRVAGTMPANMTFYNPANFNTGDPTATHIGLIMVVYAMWED